MKHTFIKGNDAIICGALCAGCRAFFGYPITPASEIAHDAMKYFPMAGALALQAESEVAAINMLYGAGAGGTAAMTATSGPGFSLMQEGISYMAAARIPGVIVDIMRSGPGLGNIGPEQGDYNMAVHGGGHGHYHNIVFAPASVAEMFSMTIAAFEATFKYRTPVCILADAFIGQMMETIALPEDLPDACNVPEIKFPYSNGVTGNADTRGHVISSLELIPQKLHEKNEERFADYKIMQNELPESEIDGSEDTDIVLVAFGICARIARDAVEKARENHQNVTLFRPKTLWPFDENALLKVTQKASKIIVVECSRGMMQNDIERFCGRSRVSGVYADGGIIPTSEQIQLAIDN